MGSSSEIPGKGKWLQEGNSVKSGIDSSEQQVLLSNALVQSGGFCCQMRRLRAVWDGWKI
ncbi:hypothetical protein E5329_23270 [Petralouisia muris]|uniref:Uncharacterized protein n=1 Tax=Petralouisia muris TaxID=3032872 RepID=A0AC61RPV1_9FIRM|nr:hypothetical protein [Petralouisia muris]TGY91015.1 hypothetical protein E5329_23270 [Petralouisia muris]